MTAMRVLDLSGPIGAYCSKLLADLGADVVFVEPPAGDDLRRRPPFVSGESLAFAAYHSNKRGITLDWSRADALPVLERLGTAFDVVLASPSRRRPLAGFDRDNLSVSWTRDDAIVAAITPFGLTGPWRDLRATAFVSFAMGGGMHWVGDPEGPPHAAPGRLAWDEAGAHAALGVLAAVSARDRVGGQLLDLSVHEVAAAKDFLFERYDVDEPGGWGRTIPVGYPPTGIWECADGPLAVAVHQVHHWPAFLAMLGDPDDLSDPIYADALFRREAWDLLRELIAPHLRRHHRHDLFARGQDHGLPCAPYNTPAEFIVDAQTEAREIVGTVDSPAGPVRIPWRWGHASVPLLELRRGAPALGAHNAQVYGDELGIGPEELAAWGVQGLV
jgi:benzylsuccinate CoA-transferase BbsE subunit